MLLKILPFALHTSPPSVEALQRRSCLAYYLVPQRQLNHFDGRKLDRSNPTAEQKRVVAYCRQPASTLTPGIESRRDPWPYICSVSRLLFFLLSLFLL
jgi:hypothetical protein